MPVQVDHNCVTDHGLMICLFLTIKFVAFIYLRKLINSDNKNHILLQFKTNRSTYITLINGTILS